MVVDGAGGINAEAGIEAPLLDQVPEYAFRRRTPADVAEADEEHGELFGLRRGGS